ncbi:MAG: glycosyltransferase [Phycisphaeraceae bacterium]|nr:glycosyltransferase [Phycisphaeraceae bacterium]
MTDGVCPSDGGSGGAFRANGSGMPGLRWPRIEPDAARLPATLPDGSPWPRISIVTPTFNQGRFIEETLLSVINQGYPSVEHIVVDGASTDETGEILARYRERLAHVVSEKDRGQSDAINKGMRLATGEILTWLNSDDMLAPGALHAAALAFWRHQSDMVAGVCELYRDGEIVHRHLTACPNGPLSVGELLDLEGSWLRGRFFYQPEVMFTRELWERAGAHVREDAFYSMDYELWLRFAHAGAKMRVIASPIAHFRVHDDQKTAVAENYRAELPRVRDEFARERSLTVPKARPEGRARLKVVLFNDIGYTYGAGIAHKRVAAAFTEMGHDVVVLAATSVHPTREQTRLGGESVLEQIERHSPDLVVIGNLHGAGVSAETIGLIAGRFQTVFVMHDLWLVTGRCAYTGGCRAYLSGCSQRCTCPPGYPDAKPEAIAPMWNSKRRVLSSSPKLAVAGDSRHVAGVAEEAVARDPLCAMTGVRPPVSWIKYGFETDVFVPRDRRLCRELLGLPQDAFIVLSSASSLDDERKGLAHLAEAMESLDLCDALVVCVGHLPPDRPAPIPGMRAMGYMDDPMRLAMLYSACDIFVGPSLEEAFGQVFVEAAACGTPSVGYPVDGVPEAITHGVTGLVADACEPASLARAIETLYRDHELRRTLSLLGPIHVRNEWSMTAAAHRWREFFRETGLEKALRLGARMDLGLGTRTPPSPQRLASVEPGWRAVSGFDHWEGPYPEQELPRCRWILGPVARFEVDVADAGPHRVVIRYRNFEQGQRVRLVGERGVVAEREVPPTPAGHKPAIAFITHLKKGVNALELHVWKWRHGERPMSLLVTNVRAIPTRAMIVAPRVASTAEAKPAQTAGA